MEREKEKIIETLTGIRSSKKNYYVELQQNIDEVTLRNKQLEIINQVAKSFNVDLPIEQLINSLLVQLSTVIALNDFSLSMLFDGECRYVLGGPGSVNFKSTTCSPNGTCRYIIRNKKSLLLPDEGEDLGLALDVEDYQGSAVVIPLLVKKRVIGILKIKSNSKGAFSRQDVHFLEQLADHLAVGLNNIKLFNDVLVREREWEDTFRAITDAIIIINTEHKIIRSNVTAKKIFQLGDQESTGEKCYEIIHQRQEPCDSCPMSAGVSDLKRTYQFVEGLNKEIYDVYGYPVFRRSGRLKGVVEYFKDVTQQTAIESQLIQSEKLAAIGKLAAGVAHELNSPLTAILGNSQLLLREFSADDQNIVLMEDIKQCGVRCKNIIQNLLSFSRQQQLEGEAISLNEVLNRALRLVGHTIRQEQIELLCRQSLELPEIIGSSQQLEQVIINLLINSKDALETRDDNKVISVNSGRCMKNEQDYLFVAVEDNGCGMEEQELLDIFTPFYTTKAVGKGTGLGLAVSMGIVQNHRGTIECESSPGVGSKFTVFLPVR